MHARRQQGGTKHPPDALPSPDNPEGERYLLVFPKMGFTIYTPRLYYKYPSAGTETPGKTNLFFRSGSAPRE